MAEAKAKHPEIVDIDLTTKLLTIATIRPAMPGCGPSMRPRVIN